MQAPELVGGLRCCMLQRPARLQDMSPDPPVDSSILASKASQEEMWMFSEKPPRLPTMCRRARARLCLVHDIIMGERAGQDLSLPGC